MNTRFRAQYLLAAALGAVLLSSTLSARDMAGRSEQKSRGQDGGHAQSREPAERASAPRERTVASNGNRYGGGQPSQGNGYPSGQQRQGNSEAGGQGKHRGNDGGGSAAPPRGADQNNGSRAPGHVDAKPSPSRGGSGGGNAWNTRGKDSGHNGTAPPRGSSGQHKGSDRAPGHVDAKPVPPRSGGGIGGSGSGNAWNTRGKDSGHSTAPPRGTPGQHNGSSRPPGHVDAKPLPPRSGSGNAWNTRGNDRPVNGNNNWNGKNYDGKNYGSGNGQKYNPVRGNNSHFDSRSYFDRPGNVYRPPRVVPRLPVGYRNYSWNGGTYYQHAGLWYRPYGTRYVVVGAPYGLSVSYLPSYYSSFWFGGAHYFHADSTYYLYEPVHRTYVVTQSPYESGDEAQGSAEITDEDLYIYPAQGQSEQQQADDRYECHSWAVEQTGYDPIESDYDADRRAEYLRAMTACLTGRGYSVR
jgi:hypothetical protein